MAVREKSNGPVNMFNILCTKQIKKQKNKTKNRKKVNVFHFKELRNNTQRRIISVQNRPIIKIRIKATHRSSERTNRWVPSDANTAI